MHKDVLEALHGTILKWEKIIDGTGKDLGVFNCPLCKIFAFGRPEGDECSGCPVYEKTGLSGCQGTPLANWPRVAQDELDFLKSLLPKCEKGKA